MKMYILKRSLRESRLLGPEDQADQLENVRRFIQSNATVHQLRSRRGSDAPAMVRTNGCKSLALSTDSSLDLCDKTQSVLDTECNIVTSTCGDVHQPNCFEFGVTVWPRPGGRVHGVSALIHNRTSASSQSENILYTNAIR